jgi:hypothetical protein
MHMFTRFILLSSKTEMATNMVELVDVDLSKYMSTEKIAAMGPLERLTCSNKIQNYEVMKGLGKPNCVIYLFDFV